MCNFSIDYGLHSTDIDELRETIKNNELFFYIRLVNRGGRCPQCGSFVTRVKEYKLHKIDNAIYLNRKSYIMYSARRFICPKCGKTFYEKNPFCSEYENISDQTVKNVLTLLKKYNETFSSVAKQTGLSENEVIKIFDEHVQIERNRLSTVIGLDEFYFSRHSSHKYAMMILSLNKVYIIDLLPSREKYRLLNYFRKIPEQERNMVQYVSMDMNDNYREVCQEVFRTAKICVDPFHVIKYMNKALDNIRLDILNRYKDNKRSDEYYLLKYWDHLLYTDLDPERPAYIKKNHHFHYEFTEYEMREKIFKIDQDIYDSWLLKERLMSFYNDEDAGINKRKKLDTLITDLSESGITEMVKLSSTLDYWKEEILNALNQISKKITLSNGKKKTVTARVTNGSVEGKNKYLKILLRLANGYSNFKRFRNRAMYSLNKTQKHSEHKLINKVVNRTGLKGKKHR